jgi:hypothetical protein
VFVFAFICIDGKIGSFEGFLMYFALFRYKEIETTCGKLCFFCFGGKK